MSCRVMSVSLLGLLPAVICGEALAAEAPSRTAPKPKDPSFAQIEDVPGLPRVLIIGDSVSLGYTPALRNELADKANLHHPPANCGSTKIGLRDLDKWLGDKPWDLIHFNWGLHDLGYRFDDDSNLNAKGEYARPGNGGHQNVPPDQYGKNLRELVHRLKKTGAKLLFATTTPVPADLHSYVKAAEVPYNEVARKVMREEGIAVNDLWAFSTPQLDKLQIPGNPHFTSKGSEALARQTAQVILAGLVDEWLAPPRQAPQDVAIPAGPFVPEWKSLENYQVPDWFRDAKFGIFVHWGPQTLAGQSGSADGSKSPQKELARAFRGEKFDAAHLARTFQRAGAKYVVEVAEHHDAYALYDSSYTRWSSVAMRPQRDFVAELAAALRKEGLVFGASSHVEETWWFYSDPPKKTPPAPLPGRPVAPQPDRQFLDWWLARQIEIVDKYHPQIYWFDWCIEQPAYEPYLRKFAAYYYNRAAAWKQGAVLNYKYKALPEKAGVLDISWNTGRSSWQPGKIPPRVWQFDTMSNRNYWFWRADMEMRPASEVIAELADVVSKNGNYLLNFPPAPDGSLTPEQEKLLAAIGQWLSVNGEAIYGTRPWKVFGEGPTEGLGPKFQGNPPKAPYTAQDIRFTTKGDTLYAIVLAWPENRKATIRSLTGREIKSASLLGSGSPIVRDGVTFELPTRSRRDGPFVLKIQ